MLIVLLSLLHSQFLLQYKKLQLSCMLRPCNLGQHLRGISTLVLFIAKAWCQALTPSNIIEVCSIYPLNQIAIPVPDLDNSSTSDLAAKEALPAPEKTHLVVDIVMHLRMRSSFRGDMKRLQLMTMAWVLPSRHSTCWLSFGHIYVWSDIQVSIQSVVQVPLW